MAPRRKNNQDSENLVKLPEAERLMLQQKVVEFTLSNDRELAVPDLSTAQRKYLHQYASRMGLKTQSSGKDKSRVLHIMNKAKNTSSIYTDARALRLRPNTRQMLHDLAPMIKESFVRSAMQQRDPNCQKQTRLRGEALLLGLGPRLVPPRPNRIANELFREKKELPIYQYKEEICKILQNSSIFIVNGETGSGKTTQIPQYILAEANRCNRPCRILVTQPRRMAAVTVAHRVAEERGEQIGETVGYQIRMESRIRKTTNLIYTTSGCFLRSIMADVNDLFRKVTHVVIDEIHERDKYTDFTLITIKNQLKHNKDLKVILMSATMDINLLSKYFNGCPILNVPGQSYDVKLFHLEDILYHTGYRTLLMEKYLRLLAPNEIPLQPNNAPVRTLSVLVADDNIQDVLDKSIDFCCDPSAAKTVDDLFEVFDQLHYCIESEEMPVDGGHSKTGITPLIAACKCNCPKYVYIFLHLKASALIRDIEGRSAADYASEHADGECLQILQSYGNISQQQQQNVLTSQIDIEKERLLAAYHQQFNDEYDVDHDLILSLLEGLYRSSHPGAIMVFLPGYSDIVAQRDLISSTLPLGTYKICILHGQMDSHDQWEALQPQPVRKIILSTNIGQTSITIPDLAYIIDSGKVKMKTFDSITESSQLLSMWISQADASQRSGRAGRTQNGICYRLYSLSRYNFMSKFCVPEFMRIPLTEICLFAKTLDKHVSVQTYLSRALNPPSTMSIQNAVHKLEILQIFNADESVTEMGRHLVEIPLDVQLGKCLLYSIYLKCIDPVLTIVAFHSVKDPFILPNDRAQQGHASFQRKSFAGQSFSDQQGIVALHDAYVALRYAKKKQDFCHKYFLSQSGMEMFCATRRQIADLIRIKFRLGVNATIFNSDWNMVRYCLVAGFYPNIAVVDRPKIKLTSESKTELILQRTSALNPPGMKNLKDFVDSLPHDWIIFYEKSRLHGMCSINMNTVIPPVFVALQCGHDVHVQLDDDSASDANSVSSGEELPANAVKGTDSPYAERPEVFVVNDCNLDELSLGTDSDSNGKSPANVVIDTELSAESHVVLVIDNWIKFDMLESEARLLMSLRELVHKQFLEFLQNGPTKRCSEAVIYLQKFLSSLPPDKTNKSNVRSDNGGEERPTMASHRPIQAW